MTSQALSGPVIVAMLKAPRAGFVKTRLAREIGAEAAALVYRRLVEHQVAMIPRDWRVEIHFAPADAGTEMRRWLGPAFHYFAQIGEDLGDRLERATEAAFARRAKAAIVIGGDCPGLDEATLRSAWVKLQRVDVVIGPARDGGYYLMALRRSQPELFSNIPWSSDQVFGTTMMRIERSGKTHALLECKEDVDDLASWKRLQSLLPPPALLSGATLRP